MKAKGKNPSHKEKSSSLAVAALPVGNNKFATYITCFLLGGLILATLLIYWPALSHQFTNWDDNDYVTENRYIRSFSGDNLEYIFTKPIALNYHPLTIISLAVNYRFSGNEPFSYFLVNILLHLFNIMLTFYLAFLLLGKSRPMALFVAAVFALHPMHVESVAWISERKDVLFTFFFLAGMIAWIFFVEKRKWNWYALSLMLFILSGLSKPSAVVFPLVLFLVDFLYQRRFSFLIVAEKLPFLLIAAAIGLATLNAQVGISVVDVKHYNALQQVLFASYGFFIYIGKLFVPLGLSALHPVPVFNTSPDLPWIYYVSPVFNLVILASVLYSLKYTRMLFFGLMFYLLNIVLTLQFMQVGSAVIAERYTYLSYTGLLIGLAWLIESLQVKYHVNRRWVYLLMVLFTGLMAFASIQRVAVWKNSGTLWTDVLAKYPASYTAYNNRGYFYVNEGNLDRALPDFNAALDIMPGFVDALNNRGSLYRLQDQPRKAIIDYTAAIRIDPEHVRALAGRGNAYATLGILDSALADYNRAYDLDPVVAGALGDRGSVLFRLGQYEKAIADCSRKIAADPLNTATYLNRAVSYSSLKEWKLAIPDYTFVLKTRKDNPAIYEWRGVALRNTGSFDQAIQDFTEALRLAPAKPSVYINRAKAYELAGQHQKALNDIMEARRLGVNVTEKSVFSTTD